MRFSIFSVLDHYPERRSAKKLFDELLEQIALADRLGFDVFWIAEHHFDDYGAMPAPLVFLAAAAARTKRIRLGVAVSVLPLNHPVRLAEALTTVDILSGGRLEIGAGSGYRQEEYGGFGVDLSERRSRFDECMDLMLPLVSGEQVHHAGEHWRFDGRLQIASVQRPHPPVTVGVIRPPAAYWIGRKGFHCMTVPYVSFEHADEANETFEAYYKGAGEAGRERAECELTAMVHTYVCPDGIDARTGCEAEVEAYMASRDDRKQASRFVDYDFVEKNGFLVAGQPAEVAGGIRRWQARGVTDYLALMDFGCMDHDKVCASMTRFAEEVIPRVRGAETRRR